MFLATEVNEREVAHTLLVLGATYINGRSKNFSEKEAEDAITIADRCLEIRERLCDKKYLASVTEVYEARLLRGTMLFFTSGKEVEGANLLLDCLRWSRSNPTNTYHEIIESEVGRLFYLKLGPEII